MILGRRVEKAIQFSAIQNQWKQSRILKWISPGSALDLAADPYHLVLLKHFRSPKPLAMDAIKPMFFLRSADGASGVHQEADRSCYRDFKRLAQRIAGHTGVGHLGTADQ